MPGEGGCCNSPLPHITTLFIITKKGHLTQCLLMDEQINKMSTWWDGSQCINNLSDAITHHDQGNVRMEEVIWFLAPKDKTLSWQQATPQLCAIFDAGKTPHYTCVTIVTVTKCLRK